METSRRNFLRLAPASVGAIALGAAVLPEKTRKHSLNFEGDGRAFMTQADWDKWFRVIKAKSATPPLMYGVGGEVKFKEV